MRGTETTKHPPLHTVASIALSRRIQFLADSSTIYIALFIVVWYLSVRGVYKYLHHTLHLKDTVIMGKRTLKSHPNMLGKHGGETCCLCVWRGFALISMPPCITAGSSSPELGLRVSETRLGSAYKAEPLP